MIQSKKKVAWITGGGTGIGKELAKRFSDKKYKVIVSGRRLSKLKDIQKYNEDNIIPMKLDVTNYKKCKQIAELILKKFGSIDIIILNAATYNPGSLEKINVLEIKKIVETNILGPINCYSPVLEYMKKIKKGHLVFVSSPAGYRGLPGAGIYGVTKSAITFLAETLKLEYDIFNIKVQVVHPGFIKTPMTDKNTFDMPFIMSAQKAADIIMSKIFTRTFEIFFPKRLILPMKLLQVIPFPIYSFLMKNLIKRTLNG